MKAASQNLRIAMSRFEALEALTRVGLDVDASTQSVILRGRLMRELLRQGRLAHRSTADQVLLLTATSEGWFDHFDTRKTSALVERILSRARSEAALIMSAIDQGTLPQDWKETLAGVVRPAVEGIRV